MGRPGLQRPGHLCGHDIRGPPDLPLPVMLRGGHHAAGAPTTCSQSSSLGISDVP